MRAASLRNQAASGPGAPFFDAPDLAALYDARTRDYREDRPLLEALARECGGPALDAACGCARATCILARVVQPVVGIDHSAEMLRIARAKALGLERPPWLIRVDLRRFRLDAGFALITCVCNSFVDLVGTEAQLAGLRNLRRHLAHDGRLLIDVTPRHRYEAIDGKEVPLGRVQLGDRSVECSLESRIIGPDLRLETFRYAFYASGRIVRRARASHRRALIDHARMLELARAAELRPVSVLSSHAGEPYREDGPWQVYVLAAAGGERPRSRESQP